MDYVTKREKAVKADEVKEIDVYKCGLAEPKKRVHTTAVTNDYPGAHYTDPHTMPTKQKEKK